MEGGLSAIHLRRHDLTAAEVFALASKLRKLTQDHDAFLIVNDRLDVALAVKADAIHLGRHGMPLMAARALMAGQMSLGFSAHSEADIAQAAIQGADYCSLSPVFPPISKEQSRPPIGLEGLKRAVSRSVLPIAALGGVTAENCAQVLETGAAGVVTSGALGGATTPLEAARAFAKAVGC